MPIGDVTEEYSVSVCSPGQITTRHTGQNRRAKPMSSRYRAILSEGMNMTMIHDMNLTVTRAVDDDDKTT